LAQAQTRPPSPCSGDGQVQTKLPVMGTAPPASGAMAPARRQRRSGGATGGGSVRLLAAVAGLCAQVPSCAAVSLRSGVGQPGAFKPPAAEPPFGCCDAEVKRLERKEKSPKKDKKLEKRFLLEWVPPSEHENVGLIGHSLFHFEMETGAGRMSKMNMQGSKCLTAGKRDAMGGTALGWSLCRGGVQGDEIGRNQNDGTISNAGEAALQAARRSAQEFILDSEGRLKTQLGLCVRRVKAGYKCSAGVEGSFYDLGSCTGDVEPATFIAKKAVHGDPTHLSDRGYLVDAVKDDECAFCGPYIVQERCLSGGGPSVGAPGCPPDFRPNPGWTRQPATYVGDAAAAGEAGRGRARDISEMASFNSEANDLVTMSGFGATSEAGLCGSFVEDGPWMNSAFYLHQVGEHE
jgi:hypothetical protein